MQAAKWEFAGRKVWVCRLQTLGQEGCFCGKNRLFFAVSSLLFGDGRLLKFVNRLLSADYKLAKTRVFHRP